MRAYLSRTVHADSVRLAPPQIVRRVNVFKGPIVSMRVHDPMVDVSVRLGESLVQCAKFIRPLIGGYVTAYVLASRAATIGERFTAHATVWRDFYDDGRSYPALYLTPTRNAATHTMHVISHVSLPEKYRGDDCHALLPSPLRGWIVFRARAIPETE